MKVKVTQSCPTLCDPLDYTVPGQNTGMGSLSFLQGIFPTQGSNPGLLHYRRIIYHLSHQGSWKQLRDSEGQGGLTCCSSWGHKESDLAEQLHNSYGKY